MILPLRMTILRLKMKISMQVTRTCGSSNRYDHTPLYHNVYT